MLFKMELFQKGAVYDLMFKRKGDFLNVSVEEDGPDPGPTPPEPPTNQPSRSLVSNLRIILLLLYYNTLIT